MHAVPREGRKNSAYFHYNWNYSKMSAHTCSVQHVGKKMPPSRLVVPVASHIVVLLERRSNTKGTSSAVGKERNCHAWASPDWTRLKGFFVYIAQ